MDSATRRDAGGDEPGGQGELDRPDTTGEGTIEPTVLEAR